LVDFGAVNLLVHTHSDRLGNALGDALHLGAGGFNHLGARLPLAHGASGDWLLAGGLVNGLAALDATLNRIATLYGTTLDHAAIKAGVDHGLIDQGVASTLAARELGVEVLFDLMAEGWNLDAFPVAIVDNGALDSGYWLASCHLAVNRAGLLGGDAIDHCAAAIAHLGDHSVSMTGRVRVSSTMTLCGTRTVWSTISLCQVVTFTW